jgi:hypothetical protein
MPIQPYTWVTGDYPTASRFNSELYASLGQYFQPNGIAFHAIKPVLRTHLQAASWPSLTANVWKTGSIAALGGRAIADTSGYWSQRMDPASTGIVINGNVQNAGGLQGTPGGYYLVSCFTPQTSGSNPTYGCGIGTATGGTPSVGGSFQAGNTGSSDGCAFCVDLVDIAAAGGDVVPFVQSGSNQSVVSATGDGTGEYPKFQASWATVYPANGTTAALPAPKASWVNTDTISSAFLNGNTGIAAVLNYLNMPPAFRASSTGTQTVAASTTTVQTLGSVSLDTYSGWNSGTNTYTVPANGLYLVHGLTAWTGGFSGEGITGTQINGANFWGPSYTLVNSGRMSSTKTQIFSLNAGDTISMVAFQTGGVSAGTGTAGANRLIVLNVGSLGVPSPLPTLPDVTFRWAAGTSGDLSPLLNAHLANDLNFLVHKPYLLAYQSASQTGVAMNTTTQVNMDTVSGIVHSDQGDNYSGWDATNKQYVAQRPGWYLVCAEAVMTRASLTASPSNTALLGVTPHGSASWDRYQAMDGTDATNHTAPGGATALGYYYLRTGDIIRPGVLSNNTSATTTSTFVSTTRASHFECVWVSE